MVTGSEPLTACTVKLFVLIRNIFKHPSFTRRGGHYAHAPGQTLRVGGRIWVSRGTWKQINTQAVTAACRAGSGPANLRLFYGATIIFRIYYF
jgi:hypothetical protein